MKYKDAYKKWKKELTQLNKYINGLKPWNEYAESCQREYDWLLHHEPKKEDYDS